MKKIYLFFLLAGLFNMFSTGLKAQVNSLLSADSSRIKAQLSLLKTNAVKIGASLNDTTKINNQVNKVKAAAQSKIDAFSKSFSESLEKLNKQTLDIDLVLGNKTRYNPLPVTGLALGGISPNRGFVSEFDIIGIAKIYGVPLNINYSTNRFANVAGQAPGFNNDLFKFDFDPKQFTGMFKNDLEQYYDLRRQAFGGLDLTQYTRKVIADQISNAVDGQTAKLTQLAENKNLSSYLNKPENINELLKLNRQQIEQKLTKVVTANDSLAGKVQPLAQMLKDDAGGGATKYGETNKKIDSIALLITDIKSKLQKKGYDIGKMLEVQKYLEGARTGSPSEVVNSFFKNKAQTGFQSLFSNIRELKLGAYGKNIPGATQNSDLFLKGTHVTILTDNYPVTVGYGSTNDLTSYKDAGFQNSVYNSPKRISYISTEVRRGVFGRVKISFIGSLNREISNNSYTIPTVAANNVAFTINRAFNLGKLGSASVDLSKSTTIFNKNYQFGAEAILDQKGGLNSNTSSLFQAFAFGVNHHLEVEKSDMSENVYFSYSGLGYQNPGNTGTGGAKRKMGGNLRKAFYNNKFILNFRTDFTNMPISYTSNDQWKTYQFQLDSRYIINNKFNISLKYNTSGTDKQVNNGNTSVYSFQKMQFDGNASYKIGKHFSVSHFTAGVQMFSNSYVSQSAGNLLMLNYVQSVVMKKNALTLSVFYNKELSGYQLIGNMLNSDVAYQYALFHKINLSTAATYLDNTNIARQYGVKQGIQLYAGAHFDLDSYIDLRKNLIKPLYPDLYSTCRAELSLKYHLKN